MFKNIALVFNLTLQYVFTKKFTSVRLYQIFLKVFGIAMYYSFEILLTPYAFCCIQDCYYYDEGKSQYLNDSTGGPGVIEADFILYVATIQSARCGHGRTVAYAAHCQQESALDR